MEKCQYLTPLDSINGIQGLWIYFDEDSPCRMECVWDRLPIRLLLWPSQHQMCWHLPSNSHLGCQNVWCYVIYFWDLLMLSISFLHCVSNVAAGDGWEETETDDTTLISILKWSCQKSKDWIRDDFMKAFSVLNWRRSNGLKKHPLVQHFPPHKKNTVSKQRLQKRSYADVQCNAHVVHHVP